MTHFPERFFWSVMLVLQVTAIAAELLFDPLRYALLALVSLCCCVAMLGMILQVQIYRHNFWAGFVGVVMPFGIALALAVLALTGVGLTGGGLNEERVLYALTAMILQLTSFAAPFVYVYGSPQIWRLPMQATVPALNDAVPPAAPVNTVSRKPALSLAFSPSPREEEQVDPASIDLESFFSDPLLSAWSKFGNGQLILADHDGQPVLSVDRAGRDQFFLYWLPGAGAVVYAGKPTDEFVQIDVCGNPLRVPLSCLVSARTACDALRYAVEQQACDPRLNWVPMHAVNFAAGWYDD